MEWHTAENGPLAVAIRALTSDVLYLVGAILVLVLLRAVHHRRR